MAINVTQQRMAWGLKELSESLGLSVGFLRKEVKAGSLPAKRLGRRVVVLQQDLNSYLASQPVQIVADAK